VVLFRVLTLYFFTGTTTTATHTLSLHDALPIFGDGRHVPITVARHQHEIVGVIDLAGHVDDLDLRGLLVETGFGHQQGHLLRICAPCLRPLRRTRSSSPRPRAGSRGFRALFQLTPPRSITRLDDRPCRTVTSAPAPLRARSTSRS